MNSISNIGTQSKTKTPEPPAPFIYLFISLTISGISNSSNTRNYLFVCVLVYFFVGIPTPRAMRWEVASQGAMNSISNIRTQSNIRNVSKISDINNTTTTQLHCQHQQLFSLVFRAHNLEYVMRGCAPSTQPMLMSFFVCCFFFENSHIERHTFSWHSFGRHTRVLLTNDDDTHLPGPWRG